MSRNSTLQIEMTEDPLQSVSVELQCGLLLVATEDWLRVTGLLPQYQINREVHLTSQEVQNIPRHEELFVGQHTALEVYIL